MIYANEKDSLVTSEERRCVRHMDTRARLMVDIMSNQMVRTVESWKDHAMA
jgi:hypothetical protein